MRRSKRFDLEPKKSEKQSLSKQDNCNNAHKNGFDGILREKAVEQKCQKKNNRINIKKALERFFYKSKELLVSKGRDNVNPICLFVWFNWSCIGKTKDGNKATM